jgi:hypothetical protein
MTTTSEPSTTQLVTESETTSSTTLSTILATESVTPSTESSGGESIQKLALNRNGFNNDQQFGQPSIRVAQQLLLPEQQQMPIQSIGLQQPQQKQSFLSVGQQLESTNQVQQVVAQSSPNVIFTSVAQQLDSMDQQQQFPIVQQQQPPIVPQQQFPQQIPTDVQQQQQQLPVVQQTTTTPFVNVQQPAFQVVTPLPPVQQVTAPASSAVLQQLPNSANCKTIEISNSLITLANGVYTRISNDLFKRTDNPNLLGFIIGIETNWCITYAFSFDQQVALNAQAMRQNCGSEMECCMILGVDSNADITSQARNWQVNILQHKGKLDSISVNCVADNNVITQQPQIVPQQSVPVVQQPQPPVVQQPQLPVQQPQPPVVQQPQLPVVQQPQPIIVQKPQVPVQQQPLPVVQPVQVVQIPQEQTKKFLTVAEQLDAVNQQTSQKSVNQPLEMIGQQPSQPTVQVQQQQVPVVRQQQSPGFDPPQVQIHQPHLPVVQQPMTTKQPQVPTQHHSIPAIQHVQSVIQQEQARKFLTVHEQLNSANPPTSNQVNVNHPLEVIKTEQPQKQIPLHSPQVQQPQVHTAQQHSPVVTTRHPQVHVQQPHLPIAQQPQVHAPQQHSPFVTTKPATVKTVSTTTPITTKIFTTASPHMIEQSFGNRQRIVHQENLPTANQFNQMNAQQQQFGRQVSPAQPFFPLQQQQQQQQRQFRPLPQQRLLSLSFNRTKLSETDSSFIVNSCDVN